MEAADPLLTAPGRRGAGLVPARGDRACLVFATPGGREGRPYIRTAIRDGLAVDVGPSGVGARLVLARGDRACLVFATPGGREGRPYIRTAIRDGLAVDVGPSGVGARLVPARGDRACLVFATPGGREGRPPRPAYLLAAATRSAAVTGPTVSVSVCHATRVRNSRLAANPVLRPRFRETSSTFACWASVRSGAICM